MAHACTTLPSVEFRADGQQKYCRHMGTTVDSLTCGGSGARGITCVGDQVKGQRVGEPQCKVHPTIRFTGRSADSVRVFGVHQQPVTRHATRVSQQCATTMLFAAEGAEGGRAGALYLDLTPRL